MNYPWLTHSFHLTQNIRAEIAAVADRAKDDIDKLQRLHDDHWGNADG